MTFRFPTTNTNPLFADLCNRTYQMILEEINASYKIFSFMLILYFTFFISILNYRNNIMNKYFFPEIKCI